MTSISFKSISEINSFLIDVFSGFERHLLNGRDGVFDMVHKTRQLSAEFCSELADGTLALRGFVGEGGRGTVHELYERYGVNGEKQVWVSYNSFDAEGAWTTGYARVVVKTNKYASMDLTIRFDGDVLSSPDFIHESIVQALVTNLYLSCETPHVVNIYASYLCGSSSHNVIERSDLSIQRVINGNDRRLMSEVFTLENLVVWTIQVAWTAYCWKVHYGITHYDLHLDNMLLSDLANPENAFVFGATGMFAGRWIKYSITPDYAIYLPVTRFFMRIADYGFTTCTIPVTRLHSIRLTNTGGKVFGQDELLSHPELFNTLEVNYVMRTFAIYLSSFVDLRGYDEYRTVLRDYSEFARVVDPSFDYKRHLYNIYPSSVLLPGQQVSPYSELEDRYGAGTLGRIIRYRAWGIPHQSVWQPLHNIVRGLPGLGSITKRVERTENGVSIFVGRARDVLEDDVITCRVGTLAYQNGYIVQYIKAMSDDYECEHAKRIEQLVRGVSMEDCSENKIHMYVHDPNSYDVPDIARTTVKAGSNAVDARGELVRGMTKQMLLQYEKSNGQYELVFQPYGMGPGFREVMSYQTYQRNFTYTPIMNAGRPMEEVVLHLMYPTYPIRLSVNEDRSLLDEFAATGGADIVMNGGFFVVPLNVRNRLTRFLTHADEGKPIGFYYDGTEANTVLPIPLPFENAFAVVVQLADGSLEVVPYIEFVDAHEVDTVDMLYQAENATYFVVAQRQIRIDMLGKPVLREDAPRRLIGYRAAFCTGPIVMWNGRITFTREHMLTSEMVLDRSAPFADTKSTEEQVRNRFRLPEGTRVEMRPSETMVGKRYRVSDKQKNFMKFVSEVGEGGFMYGQRSSNNLTTRACMCQGTDGRWFFALAEGRGYMAPGIDRYQFTWLLSHFDVHRAINLDGGFSANWIYPSPSDGEPRFVLPSPDAQRILGSAFHAREPNQMKYS